MSSGDSVVLYLEPGDPTEKFSRPMAHDRAVEAAKKLGSEGYEVLALVTVEHAAERQAVNDGTIPGAHLGTLMNDLVDRFQRDYPGVPRESALEVISLLCTLSLEGTPDLQSALLDEIHMQPSPRPGEWRQHMQHSILNRSAGGS